jgi:hypothetical protein
MSSLQNQVFWAKYFFTNILTAYFIMVLGYVLVVSSSILDIDDFI